MLRDFSDWVIGDGIFNTSRVNASGLISRSSPGSAYNDYILGNDPQPSYMKDYLEIFEDNGGVHINSGIPNKAFYLAVNKLEVNSWEKAGKIWYYALRKLNRFSV